MKIYRYRNKERIALPRMMKGGGVRPIIRWHDEKPFSYARFFTLKHKAYLKIKVIVR